MSDGLNESLGLLTRLGDDLFDLHDSLIYVHDDWDQVSTWKKEIIDFRTKTLMTISDLLLKKKKEETNEN